MKLKYLASLKLTVALFSLSLLLLFFGTLAQVGNDISYVLDHYFRSFYCFIEFKDILPRTISINGGFPFVGGLTIGSLLLVNLLFMIPQHFVLKAKGRKLIKGVFIMILGISFLIFTINNQLSNDLDTTVESPVWRVLYKLLNAGGISIFFLWSANILYKKRGSIFIVHLAIIFLIIFEFLTYIFAEEATMTIKNKETVSFIDKRDRYELVFIDESQKEYNTVIKVPSNLLKKNLSNNSLPFDIQVIKYIKNSIFINESKTPDITHGIGLQFNIGKTTDASGVSLENSQNIPSYKLKFTDKKTKKKLGIYLVSAWFYPNINQRSLEPKQYITNSEGKKYRLLLRNQREYLTDNLGNKFSFFLEKFRHKKYIGTNMPRDFSSLIWIENKKLNIKEKINIWMNNPLRYEGKTFYQSGFLSDDSGTVLQVVKNPAWFIPYFSFMTIMISLLVHFLTHLTKHLKQRHHNE